MARRKKEPPAPEQPKPKPELTPAQIAEREARLAEINTRHERVGRGCCPDCEQPAPKHDNMRSNLIICAKCKTTWMTYPGWKK